MNEKDKQRYIPKKVLVADDEAAIRDLVRNVIVDEFGCIVSTACDGQEALEILEKDGPFDCAIIDVCMPKVDGVSFVEILLASPPVHPVIEITLMSATPHYRYVAEELGVGFIHKPFDDIADIISAISRNGHSEHAD